MAWDDPAGCRDVLGACRDPATPRGDSQPLLSLFPAPSCFPRLPSPDPPRIWAGLEVSCWLLLLRSDLIWLQMFVPTGEIPGKHKLRLVLGKKNSTQGSRGTPGFLQRLVSEIPKDLESRIPRIGFRDAQGLEDQDPRGFI